jgi:hypothetical protein
MANEQTKAKLADEDVMVTITHGRHLHKAASYVKDAQGKTKLSDDGFPVIDRSIPYGHDCAAVPGDTIILPKSEAERLVKSGSAKLAG